MCFVFVWKKSVSGHGQSLVILSFFFASLESNFSFLSGRNRFHLKMPLFGRSQKSPAELVKALKEAVTALERGEKKAEKAQEDVSKNLVINRIYLFSIEFLLFNWFYYRLSLKICCMELQTLSHKQIMW